MNRNFKLIVSSFTALMLMVPFFAVQAAGTLYADEVVSFIPGNLNNGNPITDPARTDPAAALGVPNGSFVSLGFGGELIVKFAQPVGGTLVITVYETTFGSYPEEKADVYVSEDGSVWTFIGTADNSVGQPANDPHPSVFDLSDMCVKYVKLIDTTGPSSHGPTADGFDVDAVQADYTDICEKDCKCQPLKAPVKVKNSNTAMVMNSVATYANTGNNSASGGVGGQAGNGGSVMDSDDDNTGGNGGNGGHGGDGGVIQTGNAEAHSHIVNNINDVFTLVEPACDCDFFCPCGKIDLSVRVMNSQLAHVMNGVETMANTGGNRVDGGSAGRQITPVMIFNGPAKNGYSPAGGGDGGSVIDSDDDNIGGQGGHSGSGGLGGMIATGPAFSFTDVMNRINTIVTRISR